MAKFLFLFSFSAEAVRAFVQHPGDREAAVRTTIEEAGGTLEAYYWMLGPHDGLAITDLPDSHAAAAISLAVSTSGAFRHFETHPLIEPGHLPRVAERARELLPDYRPPGQ